jgi:hypothetical protein
MIMTDTAVDPSHHQQYYDHTSGSTLNVLVWYDALQMRVDGTIIVHDLKIPAHSEKHVVNWSPSSLLPPGFNMYLPRPTAPIQVQSVSAGQGPTTIPMSDDLATITVTVTTVQYVTDAISVLDGAGPRILDESKKAVDISFLLLIPSAPPPPPITREVQDHDHAVSYTWLYRDSVGIALLRQRYAKSPGPLPAVSAAGRRGGKSLASSKTGTSLRSAGPVSGLGRARDSSRSHTSGSAADLFEPSGRKRRRGRASAAIVLDEDASSIATKSSASAQATVTDARFRVGNAAAIGELRIRAHIDEPRQMISV